MTLVYPHLGMLAEILQSCLLVPLTILQTPSRTAKTVVAQRVYYLRKDLTKEQGLFTLPDGRYAGSSQQFALTALELHVPSEVIQ